MLRWLLVVLCLATPALARDPEGGRAVFKAQGDAYRTEPRRDRKPETAVDALHVDSSGSLWFGRHGELWRRRRGESEEVGRALGLPADEFLESTLTDRRGRLWVRTHLHLYR